MNERDAMNPDATRATAASPADSNSPLDDDIELFVRRMCRRTSIGYSLDRFSYAGTMRQHLRSHDRPAVARLDCVIFTGLLMPGMHNAGGGLTMRRAVSIRDRLFTTGYRITESAQST